MKHLLSIDDLDQEQIEALLDRAESFAEVSRRDIKKVPALRGRTIVTLFTRLRPGPHPPSSWRPNDSPPTSFRSRHRAPRSRRASR